MEGAHRYHLLGHSFNISIMFMVGMVFVVLASFLGVVWWSYHSGKRRAERGEVFAPAGKLRWSPDEFRETK